MEIKGKMANEEQLDILQQGVQVWNEWRIKNSEIKIDLCETDLSGIDFRGADFSKVDLCEQIQWSRSQ